MLVFGAHAALSRPSALVSCARRRTPFRTPAEQPLMSGSSRPPRPGPTPLGDVLSATRRVTLSRSKAALDKESWRLAVGRRIAERTEVGSLRQGELTVYVASAAWAQELSLLTREICERLASAGVTVERVHFRVRAGLGKAQSPLSERKKVPVPPLPSELAARISRIGDDELRAAITQAAGLSLARLAAAPKRSPEVPSVKRGAPSRAATSTLPAARDPRAAAARSAPKAQSSVATGAAARDKPGTRRG